MEFNSHTSDVTLFFDLGASGRLTLFKSDFFNYIECSIPVHGISKVNEIIEATIHKFVDTNGQFFHLPQLADHLSSFEVCLFSPHVFHQISEGKNIVFGN